MADLPILMSPAMVRATLREIEQPGSGKTQTRRVLDLWCDEPPAIVHAGQIIAYDDGDREYRWPRTKAVGDRLYVREAWRAPASLDDASPKKIGHQSLDAGYRKPWCPIRFEADGAVNSAVNWNDFGSQPGTAKPGKFRQGMHMPRWASRITLIVTDVRVQRLQEISREDAMAEGVVQTWGDFAGEPPEWAVASINRHGDASGSHIYDNRKSVENFRELWNHINASRGYDWDANPWVAAYTFRPILGNIDQVRP